MFGAREGFQEGADQATAYEWGNTPRFAGRCWEESDTKAELAQIEARTGRTEPTVIT